MLVGLPTAQAVDTTLTLACKGTTTDRMKDGSAKKEPLSIGIIVNLTKHTVQGLLLPTSESLPITDVTDLTIDFGGGTAQGSIYGTIDRVNGDLLLLERNINRLRAKMQPSTTDVLIGVTGESAD